MTKDDLYYYIQVKKDLEFVYNGKTYSLTYGKENDGRDYICFGLLYEGERFYSYGEFINEAKIDNHFFREMLDLF